MSGDVFWVGSRPPVWATVKLLAKVLTVGGLKTFSSRDRPSGDRTGREKVKRVAALWQTGCVFDGRPKKERRGITKKKKNHDEYFLFLLSLCSPVMERSARFSHFNSSVVKRKKRSSKEPTFARWSLMLSGRKKISQRRVNAHCTKGYILIFDSVPAAQKRVLGQEN